MRVKRGYIYTHVSPFMQVDGYGLDAQRDKLKTYAEFQDMQISGEYSDQGKSGKNIEKRPCPCSSDAVHRKHCKKIYLIL